MALQRVEFLTDKHGGKREHNQLLVIHTSEGASTYRALGNFFQHSSKQASYHVGFDNTSNNQVGEYVKPPYQSWSAHRANHYGEHGCCCTPVGAAQGWSRQDWLKQPNMLEACRRWIQEEGARYGIPARKLSPDEIRKGMKGVCGHADCVAAGMGGNHTDPGPNFPWDVVCRTGPAPEPPKPPVSVGTGGQEMFLLGSTDKKYHLFGPNFTNEIDNGQYLKLASLGIPHSENENPLVVISMMKAVGTWKDSQ